MYVELKNVKKVIDTCYSSGLIYYNTIEQSNVQWITQETSCINIVHV